MCGIVAWLGERDALDILLGGLKRLEYRGYDSAGVAIVDADGMRVVRAKGDVATLDRKARREAPRGRLGIAHTRWATHGAPTERNAHPHVDASGRSAIVHNGIVENHAAIRRLLEDRGIAFRSDTDTESLAQLIGWFHRETGDFAGSVRRALAECEGTFGIAAVCADRPGTLVAARRGSPLIVGIGDGGDFVVASDAAAIAEHADRAVYLNDHEIATMEDGELRVATIDDVAVDPRIDAISVSLEAMELGAHDHYMLKEIHEQPEALRNCLAGRVDAARGTLTLGGLAALDRDLSRIRRIVLFGCGTAWHACLAGEYLLEELARIPAEVEYASELRYRNPVVEEGTLAVAVSQSGETADTLFALEEMRLRGATLFGVVNVVGSAIARETDAGAYLHVGPEIGVASTKAFTAQVAVLAMLALELGRRRHLSPERFRALLAALDRIPDAIARALECEAQVRAIARDYADRHNWLYLGRGINYPVALEGALKIKEIAYVHAEGMPAAEMKHGPIALIEPGMPVVFVAPRDHTREKVLSNIEEVRSRGGCVIAIATEGDGVVARLAEHTVFVPDVEPLFSPIVTAVPLQLLACHAALERGLNVDKPRNLAKCVTVE